MTSYIYNMVDTWDNGATTFTAIKMNVTDTASAVASLLLDIGTGGGTYASKFSVRKDGRAEIVAINLSGGTFGGNANWWSGNNLNISSTTQLSFGASDLILTRRGVANLRFGAADAAAPVAQTLSVQSVVAGTTNTAGTNLTITGSQGTGTGAGGSIIFQVAPAGSAGTAQNALAAALTIDSTKLATFGGNVTLGGTGLITGITTGASKITLDDTTGAQMAYGNVVLINSGNIYLSTGGNPRFSVRSGGEVRLDQLSAIGWSGTLNNTNAALDVSLYRDAAGVMGLRGSSTTTPGAMSFYTYGASPPAAPAASIVRLYADTSGGKIRLMAIFPSGAAQQIAIEP